MERCPFLHIYINSSYIFETVPLEIQIIYLTEYFNGGEKRVGDEGTKGINERLKAVCTIRTRLR